MRIPAASGKGDIGKTVVATNFPCPAARPGRPAARSGRAVQHSANIRNSCRNQLTPKGDIA